MNMALDLDWRIRLVAWDKLTKEPGMESLRHRFPIQDAWPAWCGYINAYGIRDQIGREVWAAGFRGETKN